MKIIRSLAVITMLTSAILVGVAGTASATPTPAPQAIRQSARVSLRITGFNAAAAKKNGYQIRTDASGHQYSVKVSSSGAVDTSVTPAAGLDTCGYGYIDYFAIGNKQAMVFSGWGLNAGFSASRFYWRIPVIDNAGVGERYYSDPLPSVSSWYIPTGWRTYHSVIGYTWAEVSYGIINLTNGGYCEVVPGALWPSTTLY